MDFLKKVESQLDMPAAEKEQVLREITSHYNEVKEELITAGATESEAGIEAEKRVGEPQDVAARLNATHASASWKSAILCAVPYFCSAIYLFASIHLLPIARIIAAAVLALIFAGASIRELAGDRRPVWLAPWLAATIAFASGTTYVALNLMYRNINVFQYQFSLILSIAWMLITMFTSWRVRKWRIAIIAFGVPMIAGAAFMHYPNHIDSYVSLLPMLLVFQCAMVLRLLFAKYVFELHPYGQAMQASFFLLVFFTLNLISVSEWDVSKLLIAQLLCGLSIIWLVRTPNRSQKILAMVLALIIWSAARIPYNFPPDWQFSSMVTYFLFMIPLNIGLQPLWVFVPILQESYTRKRNRASIAR